MLPALVFPEPDPVLEAAGDSPTRRAQRAGAAGREVLSDRLRLERAAVEQILKRLQTMQAALRQRLLADAGSVTDFRRFTLTNLLGDVDRLVADATADLADLAKGSYTSAAKLGDDHANEPIKAAQLTITRATPGVDQNLITAAFGNTADLLTLPMQQFATDVKVALRRVGVAGESRMEEIQRLRDRISGAGFDNAQFKAERIVRTELGRVFNEATFARLVALTKDFPFLRKGWKASGDRRTRTGHAEAGRTYARGQGIPIADLFRLNVYSERPGKAPVLLGQATLRFPIDPQAAPAGKLAAGATIMCRCNSFVDFSMEEFAAYSKSKVQTALQGVPRPAPTPAPAPALPKARPAKMAVPKVKVPKVQAPKAAAVMPKAGKSATLAIGPDPNGARVSAAIDVPASGRMGIQRMTDAIQGKVASALAVLDSVHSDGNLPKIPAIKVNRIYKKRGYLAYYGRNRFNDRPQELAFSERSMSTQPMLTVFHETGHFIDHVGFDSDITKYSSEHDQLLAGWREAVKHSKAIQSLQNWNNRVGAPSGVLQDQLDYLLSTRETWARSYAQYVTVKSRHAGALRELKKMQQAGTIGAVDSSTPFNNAGLGKAPKAGSWDYPWQWSDEDFKPIEEAIDVIMERLGWRKRQ